MEPGWADHVLFAMLLALPPVAGRYAYRRLKEAVASGREGVRLGYYRRTLVIQWLMAGLVMVIWLAAGRSLRDIGLLPWRGGVPAAIGLAIAAAGSVFLLRQHRAVAASEESIESARRQIAPLMDFLPNDPVEDRWFARLSVTAGICEELAYRGYIIAYLAVWVGLWPAAGLSALLFGLAHSYQGVSGVLKTGVAGAVGAVLYLACGWLIPAMLLHGSIDLGSARVVRSVRTV